MTSLTGVRGAMNPKGPSIQISRRRGPMLGIKLISWALDISEVSMARSDSTV